MFIHNIATGDTRQHRQPPDQIDQLALIAELKRKLELDAFEEHERAG